MKITIIYVSQYIYIHVKKLIFKKLPFPHFLGTQNLSRKQGHKEAAEPNPPVPRKQQQQQSTKGEAVSAVLF